MTARMLPVSSTGMRHVPKRWFYEGGGSLCGRRIYGDASWSKTGPVCHYCIRRVADHAGWVGSLLADLSPFADLVHTEEVPK